ncbi:class I poly(R)-hydroxyalkanoic acid synthase [Mycetohabitans sp. B8]|uniref:class I poly(R)-hydroxyalkanoic acid synthase n=1 Tax=Mycetohabitans sp. B8 TaxID=2841845 RepID=UPI001F00AC17|nr:class I poly(R)-hydroxyalkanoic acid synthase [Mycetohabitans sp. B8]MCG1042217.1 class I poly(R)-hydroxyalkanoic acid synthase [Mycetohabitans sp. B8]
MADSSRTSQQSSTGASLGSDPAGDIRPLVDGGLPNASAALTNSFASLGALPSVRFDPRRLQALQHDYLHECQTLIERALKFTLGSADIDGLLEPGNRRFSADEWKATPTYALTAAWYLLNSRYLNKLVDALEAEAKTRERIRFVVEQWVAAASPSNFFALNPEAQKMLLDTQGESLRRGIANLLADLQRGKISQTDESRFVVGKNLASTEGWVVFENELIQLIQYTPRTPTVHERPLLVVPPCINKFYILDLQPDNSLVRYALDEGHAVFLISWRNADASIAHKTWDDYIADGVLAAIDVTRDITGREQINTLGFCVGGTLLATALAVRAARGEYPAASMTLFTAMLDFGDTGVLDVFVDDAHVAMREQTIGAKGGGAPGLMRGVEFANTFSLLRPNDLVWNYVVDHYLKGRTPVPLDLLYWNSDSTNLPGPMYARYLRQTYLENRLRVPGGVTVCGEPVDLTQIDVPTFIYGSRDDHIVPWRTAYASTSLLSGPLKFVLGASGHIAGVINPPAKNKRSYWAIEEETRALPNDPEQWLQQSTQRPGSWWPEWSRWLMQYGGKRIKARAKAGNATYPPIEPAPGRYVLVRDV